MEIKPIINEKYTETELHVCNHEMNDEVRDLMENLKGFFCESILAKNEKGEQVSVLVNDIVSIYAESTKVFIHTSEGEFEVNKKLYEMEQSLDEKKFFRISKSELVNLKKIKRLDMGLTGTIKVYMVDGYESFTSRRNVSNLKKELGL